MFCVRLYLEASFGDLKFSKTHRFEGGRIVELELRRKQGNDLKSFSINKRNIYIYIYIYIYILYIYIYIYIYIYMYYISLRAMTSHCYVGQLP